jgi:hypothetical protein
MDPHREQSDDGQDAPPSIEAVFGLLVLAVFAPFGWYGWDTYLHSRLPIVEVHDERIVRESRSFLGITMPEEDYVEYWFAPAAGGDRIVCRRQVWKGESRKNLPRTPYRAYDATGQCDGIEPVDAYGLEWRITSLKGACLGYLVLALGIAFFIMS